MVWNKKKSAPFDLPRDNSTLPLENYDEMLKKVMAERRRLSDTKKKRDALRAQVKFLCRKYEWFVKNQPEKFNFQKCSNPNSRSGTQDHKIQPETRLQLNENNHEDEDAALPGTSSANVQRNWITMADGKQTLNQKNIEELNQTLMLDERGLETPAAYQNPRKENLLRLHQSKKISPRGILKQPGLGGDVEGIKKTGKRKVSWLDPVC